jgi:hypothetical protein
MTEQTLSDWKPRWQCAARQRNIGPEVQDCDWPVCGCDPYADKVLDAIAESGFTIVKENRPHWARVRSALQAAKDCLQPYSKIEYGADNTPQPNWPFDVAQMCREAIYEMDQLAMQAGDGVAECPAWKEGI